MTVGIAIRHTPLLHAPQRCLLLLLVYRGPSPRHYSDFSQLRESMVSRKLPYAADYMTPIQTRALRLTLLDFLPFSSETLELKAHRLRHDRMLNKPLSPTHHLVYFPNVYRSSLLLPDGTDTGHSPGVPFTRRLWVGGTMAFLHDVLMDGNPFHCSEIIEDVQVRGTEGEEKIYVKVKRYIFAGRYPGEFARHQPDKSFLARLNTKVRILEDQTFVFMQDNHREGTPAATQTSSNVLKPTHAPEFSHTMVPTRELLFRFSALTFNAHAIHFDKQYCREVEGHRNLLVHGSLTVVLMTEVLRSHLQALADSGKLSSKQGVARIEHIAYRNLAPLYAEEEMKICVRRRVNDLDQEGNTIWDVWIEGSDGGYAVKGTVKTSTRVTVGLTPSRPFSVSTDAQQEFDLEEESIPKENVALQKASTARDENEFDEDGFPDEDFSAEERSALEAGEKMEENSAPYNQRCQQPSRSRRRFGN